MELNQIHSSALSWGEAASSLNQNFSKIGTDMEKMRYATTRNKGYFSSGDALKEAVESAVLGDIAYVKHETLIPYEVWEWTVDGWVGTGIAGGDESISLGDYYTSEDVDTLFENHKVKIATDEVVGGIIAEEKTEFDVTEVKIDPATGKLYTPGITVEGDITPDEEDLTATIEEGKAVVRFRDREAIRGKGYLILRSGKSAIEQITKPNTIYEIRYDFDLGGETLEVPAGCVLVFKGGSFGNGVLVGNLTSITAPMSVVFREDLLLEGSFNADSIKAMWFGVVGDGTDESAIIQKAIDFSANTNTTIQFEAKTYIIDKPLLINRGSFTIDGNRCNFIKTSATTTGIGTVESHAGNVNMDLNTIFAVYGGITRLSIKNCSLHGDENNKIVNGITVAKANNCTFEGIVGWNLNNGFEIFNCWMSKLDMCRINNSNNGFKYNVSRTDGTKQSTGTSNVLTNCYANACGVGFWIDGIDYSTLNSCACDNCSISYNVWQSSMVLNGCGSEGCDRLFHISGRSCITVNSMESYDVSDNANFNLITVAGESKFTMVSSYIRNVQTYFIQAKDTASVLLYNNFITDGQTEKSGRVRADSTATISIIKNGVYYFYGNGESSAKRFLLEDYLPAAYLLNGAIRKATVPALMVYHQENVEANTVSIPISKIQEYIPGFNNNDGYLNEPIKVDVYSRRFYTIGNIINCHKGSTPSVSTDKAVYDGIQITGVSISSGNLILTLNNPLIYYRVKISLP